MDGRRRCQRSVSRVLRLSASRNGSCAEAVDIAWARHGAERLTTENALAEMFNTKYPNVVVTVGAPWDDYNAKIPVMVAGGTALTRLARICSASPMARKA